MLVDSFNIPGANSWKILSTLPMHDCSSTHHGPQNYSLNNAHHHFDGAKETVISVDQGDGDPGALAISYNLVFTDGI
ncbi:hypothetical protein BOTNAR_0036g00340 [Botryotinia narcissicola]|uniref:Uncharacterized protein n=1 Tax=Botryotinia narcissicola TaxID=278944 RepID=A0A4Z1JFN3_9HELO|nr:hypothetical protein BOTNAR_0036g00340 [Botryotinia narcissicola]